MVRLVRGNIDWPGTYALVLPYVESAMKEGADRDWTMDQVLVKLQTGEWGLYGVLRGDEVTGAGVTAITQFGKRRVMEIILFGADINSRQWIETLDALKAEARRFECSALQGRGRAGWARYLDATPIHSFEIEV